MHEDLEAPVEASLTRSELPTIVIGLAVVAGCVVTVLTGVLWPFMFVIAGLSMNSYLKIERYRPFDERAMPLLIAANTTFIGVINLVHVPFLARLTVALLLAAAALTILPLGRSKNDAGSSENSSSRRRHKH